MNLHKLIFSQLFNELGIVVRYLDVGARGDIGEPWSLFREGALNVIGFEPDPEEACRLSAANPNRKYYPYALWGSKTVRPFYLCEWESTSSMYPPNEASNIFYVPQHWQGRVSKRVLDVECVTPDSVLQPGDMPDFVKIDTQGAELEILSGSVSLLKHAAPFVLAETWCSEIYKGIPLTHDVMAFMYGLGYTVFDLNVAAAWHHRTNALAETHCKAKTIGFDLLFIKKFDCHEFKSVEELLKYAGLCELYAFRDYAIAALEQSPLRNKVTGKAVEEMIRNEQWERSWPRKLQVLCGHMMRRRTNLWPRLH